MLARTSTKPKLTNGLVAHTEQAETGANQSSQLKKYMITQLRKAGEYILKGIANPVKK
jgi:hypothetical protein